MGAAGEVEEMGREGGFNEGSRAGWPECPCTRLKDREVGEEREAGTGITASQET